MFWVKVFRTKFDLVVAACDEDIIDKVLNYKDLKIKISRNFYGERLIKGEILLKILSKATIANLFGKRVVELAEKNGFISRENIIVIDGIPHAQFVKIEV